MSAAQQHVYRAPFDAIADRYDQSFTYSWIGQAQRAPVWNELAKVFRPGQHVLEIGCGTGIDASFLGKRAVKVTACDSSPEMIAVATRRVQAEGLQQLVKPLVLRAEDVAKLRPVESYDGAFSNFGVLNCLDDLSSLSIDLARLLKPGAAVMLCWMGPCCAWETLWYLGHGERRKAFRRWKRGGVNARLADGAFLRVHYPTVRSLARAFDHHFRVRSIKGVGIAVPPSYLEPLAQRHPRMLRACERFDSVACRIPGIRVLADHVLIHLEKNDSPPGTGER
jgi:SAM-dependent methyltransferase